MDLPTSFRDGLRQLREGVVLRNTAYLIGNSASLAAAGFLFWVVAARRFPAEHVGVATALISMTYMITLASTAGMGFSALRNLPRTEDTHVASRVVNTCLAASGVLGLVGAAAFLALAPRVAPDLAHALAHPVIVGSFILWVALQTTSAVMDNVLTAAYRSDLAFWKNNVANALKLLVVLLAPVSLGAYAIFAANTAPIALVVLAGAVLVLPVAYRRHSWRVPPAWRSLKHLAGFALVAHVAHLFYMAPQLLLPLLVLGRLGAENAAYLYTSWKIAGLLWMFTVAAMHPLLAYGSANPDRYHDALKRVLVVFVGVTAALAVVLVAFGHWVLLLFGDAYAANGRVLLAFLAVSSVPVGLFALYLTTLRVFARSVELVLASAAFAAATITAFVLAPGIGGLAAYGMTWLAATGGFGVLATFRLLGPTRVTGFAPRAGPVSVDRSQTRVGE